MSPGRFGLLRSPSNTAKQTIPARVRVAAVAQSSLFRKFINLTLVLYLLTTAPAIASATSAAATATGSSSRKNMRGYYPRQASRITEKGRAALSGD